MGESAANSLFVALEGIDGAGTTTHCHRLGEHLRGVGRDVVMTAEPSKGAIGQLIRSILRGEQAADDASLALLFAADRLDHLETLISPALKRGATVISDRYVLSSLAYQSLNLPLPWVEQINNRARIANTTLYLHITPEAAAERLRHRGVKRERFDDLATQTRIARNYQEILSMPLAGKVYEISTERDTDEVAEQIAGLIDECLGVH